MASKTCTVVIVNWNSWDVLTTCLDRLDEQTFQDFDVLVVDNASIDPAPDGIFNRSFNVTYIQNDSNLGFAAANNQAIRSYCKSEWVVLLNPDAFPEKFWLQELVCAANTTPGFVMFASRQLMASSNDTLDGDGDVYHLSGLVWRSGHGKRIDVTRNASKEVFSPCAAAAMYRRDVLMSVGLFDEDYFCYIEDVDLGFRLRLQGYDCLLVPKAVVHHVGSVTSGGQQSDFAVYHGHRNLVWAYVKNMPGILFWLCLPIHLAINVVSIFIFSFKGKGRVIMKAKCDALFGLSIAWKKRREIQSRRSVSVWEIWRKLDKRILLHR